MGFFAPPDTADDVGNEANLSRVHLGGHDRSVGKCGVRQGRDGVGALAILLPFVEEPRGARKVTCRKS